MRDLLGRYRGYDQWLTREESDRVCSECGGFAHSRRNGNDLCDRCIARLAEDAEDAKRDDWMIEEAKR